MEADHRKRSTRCRFQYIRQINNHLTFLLNFLKAYFKHPAPEQKSRLRNYPFEREREWKKTLKKHQILSFPNICWWNITWVFVASGCMILVQCFGRKSHYGVSHGISPFRCLDKPEFPPWLKVIRAMDEWNNHSLNCFVLYLVWGFS